MSQLRVVWSNKNSIKVNKTQFRRSRIQLVRGNIMCEQAKDNIIKWNEHKHCGALVPLALSSLVEGQQMKIRFSSLLYVAVCVCVKEWERVRKRTRRRQKTQAWKLKTECETVRGFLPKHKLHITESGEKCFCVCSTRPELKLHPCPNIITGSNFPQSSAWRRSEWGLAITLRHPTSKPLSTLTHFTKHRYLHLSGIKRKAITTSNFSHPTYEHLFLLQLQCNS